MSSLYDEDGIDGPFGRHMRAAEREDVRRALARSRRAVARRAREGRCLAGCNTGVLNGAPCPNEYEGPGVPPRGKHAPQRRTR